MKTDGMTWFFANSVSIKLVLPLDSYLSASCMTSYHCYSIHLINVERLCREGTPQDFPKGILGQYYALLSNGDTRCSSGYK